MNEELTGMMETYARLRGLEVTGTLGTGTEGRVWLVRGKGKNIPWALKMQREAAAWRRERTCYGRLALHGVTEVAGFAVPVLLHEDAEWRALEMSVVARPFIVDFAQAYLDEPPDFPPEVWAERWETWEGRYGTNWPQVRRALAELEELGIHYLDVHGGNIAVHGEAGQGHEK